MNTIVIGIDMREFKPIKQEKAVISVRLNVSTLQTVDDLSIKTDISRNEFIVQCIEYALNNIQEN
ncbi:MAG: hypothetical protein IJY61_03195 [Candidatus Gastranaerophilales bacterium]|nr:hypothetical protein [Candidatus Gastranaerophilales bacterium]